MDRRRQSSLSLQVQAYSPFDALKRMVVPAVNLRLDEKQMPSSLQLRTVALTFMGTPMVECRVIGPVTGWRGEIRFSI
jgi:hypothetical protein